MAAIALTVLCALATAALVACERRESVLGRRISKSIASMAFVLLPLAAGAPLGDTYVMAVLIGLILGAGGDVALLGRSRKALGVGIGLFLGGHIAYLVAFIPRAEASTLVVIVGVVATIVGVAAGVYVWSSAGNLRPAVVVYIIVIVAMLTAAVGVTGPSHQIIAAGGALFFVSDLAVARQRFRTKAWINRALGLPAYYGGQLLIAWSCAGAGS